MARAQKWGGVHTKMIRNSSRDWGSRVPVTVSLLPYVTHMSGPLYLVAALVLGGVFLYYAISLFRGRDDGLPMRTFVYSIYYLMGLFSGLSFCLDQDGLTSPAGPFFCFGNDPDNRIFYDLVHPSSKAHGLIAAAVIDVKVAEPSTIALVLFGMIWLVCWAGRSDAATCGTAHQISR